MPRRHRKDYPGAWWHVGNRGVDQTDIFREPEDYRHFMALLAVATHRGWIELHAWCLMPNHFHLLVRSPGGELARAMQQVQDRYALDFNQKYDLCGHRLESRYWAKLILTLTYRMAALGYVHRNPRDAGLEKDGTPYPWSSERDYESERGRPWLTRTFGLRLPPSVLDGHCVAPDLVEAWLTDPAEDLRDLDRLLRSTTDGLRRWLVGRAGSGSLACRPRFLVRAATLIEVLRSGRDEAPGASTRAGRRTVSIWPLLLVGLLRTVSAVRVQGIADVAQIGLGTAEGRVRRHLRALLEDERYALQAALTLRACLRRDYAGLTPDRIAAVPRTPGRMPKSSTG